MAQTSLWLAEQGAQVSVIGTDTGKLSHLQQQNRLVHPVSVDYTDDAPWRSGWVRSSAGLPSRRQSPGCIGKRLRGQCGS
ncbi:hypothetical protein WJ0W_001969 [Paenibacillus melissococcoides]|uniref:Uncharacterized protein n=1 Tax=Paenibacillus melissococcoides TaxID=2912268 RepID=A0ABM9FZL0_9BACL|nr:MULTISPECIES: hypothetical protein [Paenibacillus]MEB9892839.1 hypothetical protein [Bacillus cereus]CAH8244739.1 hypothetical protein WJ0W_001969 [Paenibacillus melissococcoides]CAH8708832.1 hypothetical protein WDD9_002052 [Paenibacillus melissococcoides]CAH8709581.1 hypothetical protein HTL2_002338 [Paenibacillus melissococcoides]